jgi:hypothetical protein
LTTTTSGSPSAIASTVTAVTSAAAIAGIASYVGTSGESTIARVSPSTASSRPPLRKYVTCAYFSDSAHRNCVRPAAASAAPSGIAGRSALNATGSPKRAS